MEAALTPLLRHFECAAVSAVVPDVGLDTDVALNCCVACALRFCGVRAKKDIVGLLVAGGPSGRRDAAESAISARATLEEARGKVNILVGKECELLCPLCVGLCSLAADFAAVPESPDSGSLVPFLRDWEISEPGNEFTTFKLTLDLPNMLSVRQHCALLALERFASDFAASTANASVDSGARRPFTKGPAPSWQPEIVELREMVRQLVAENIQSLVSDMRRAGSGGSTSVRDSEFDIAPFQYHPDADLIIGLAWTHRSSDDIASLFSNIAARNNKRVAANKFGKQTSSVSMVRFAMAHMTDVQALIAGGLPCPPRVELSESPLPDFSVVIGHEPVFVGGRYLKRSTHCSQSPWSVTGASGEEERVTDVSVQELLADPLRSLFGSFSDVKMMSSGREDQDVRMLGNGRPFCLEISNPRKLRRARQLMLERAGHADSNLWPTGQVLTAETRFSEEAARLIVSAANNILGTEASDAAVGDASSDVARAAAAVGASFATLPIVEGLQLCLLHRNDRAVLIEGEAEKKKTYRALVWFGRPISKDDADFVALEKYDGGQEEFVIDQWTPVRVLHRRAMAMRPRTIHSLHMELLFDTPTQTETRYAFIDLCTQAGTYIKEFVHGDLGRTTPSIADLMHCDSDILQLDVINIDLEFPPRVLDRSQVQPHLALDI